MECKAKTTFKVGDKVRILDVKKIFLGERYWENGDISEVKRLLDDGRPCLSRNEKDSDESGLPLWSNELQYIELVSSKQTKNQRITTLEQAVEALKVEIEALKSAQKSADIAKIAEGLAKVVAKEKKLTPNEQRIAIIDEAKAFVNETERKMSGWLSNDEGNYTYRNRCTFAKYHINTEKRIVTALVRHEETLELLEKGIAKCAPGDVFNEHIGKAIALGRALGLGVRKFEKAVQPSEVVYGMVVRGACDGFYNANRTFTINGERREYDAFYYEEAKQYGGGGNDWIRRKQIGVIVNDSEAQY